VFSSTSIIESSSLTTEAGEALFRRVRPEPFSPLKRAPCFAAKPRTTETPPAVEPLPPNSEPTSLSSISARKLFDGTFVSWTMSAIVGEA